MKVLMLTDMFPSIDNPSSGIFIYELVRRLARSCQIDLIYPRFWYPLGGNHRLPQLRKGPERDNSPLCNTFRPRLFILPRGDRLFLRSFIFSLAIIPWLLKKRKTMDYDLVHAHMAIPAGFAGVIAAKFLRRPVLITCHGSDIHTYPKYRFLRSMVFYSLNRAQGVVFVSNALLEAAIRLGLSHQSASVIHNGVDRSSFSPTEKATCRRRLGLEVKPKVILFIGNLLHVKGVAFLIDAFADLTRIVNNIRLIIIGKGEQEGELRKRALAVGIADSVRFMGLVAHAEVPTWINACDVFCLPSIREGFPTVIPEVLSCGRPVVASRVGGIPEILTNSNQGILVPPRDHVTLSRALSIALDSNWDAGLISKSVDGYSWESIAAEYVRFYGAVA